MNNKEATELARRFPEIFATLREYIENSAASLDIGHSCLSGDRWMRDASYYGN